jgi:hypothetical protein
MPVVLLLSSSMAERTRVLTKGPGGGCALFVWCDVCQHCASGTKLSNVSLAHSLEQQCCMSFASVRSCMLSSSCLKVAV